MNIIQRALPVMCFLGAPFLSAWAGDGNETDVAGMGTLSVNLTNSMTCNYSQVNVSLEYVKISGDGIAWTIIPVDSAGDRIELLGLSNGTLLNLGQASLPAGVYRQVGLVLKENGNEKAWANSVVLAGAANETPLETPAAKQENYKIIGPLTVQAGRASELVLDFDACKSISISRAGTGQLYLLKPVVTPIAKEMSGSISGKTAPYSRVFAEQQSTSGPIVIKGTIADSSGGFTLAFIESGKIADVVVIPPAAASRATVIIQNVPVTAGNTTSVGEINPPASSIHTVSGAVTEKTSGSRVAANLKAEQTVTGTNRSYLIASMISGTGHYRIPLTGSGPWLGTYSPVLPILLKEDRAPADSGIHSITATDALGYASIKQINVSGGPVSLDFNLGQTKK